jgi:hypothetical protein
LYFKRSPFCFSLAFFLAGSELSAGWVIVVPGTFAKGVIGLAFKRPKNLRHQLKEGMDYFVVIATTAVLASSAILAYRTLPKERNT